MTHQSGRENASSERVEDMVIISLLRLGALFIVEFYYVILLE